MDTLRWLLDAPLTFTPHLTVVGALLFGLAVVQRQWAGGLLLLLLVLTGALLLLRSERHLARAQACSDPDLRVTTYNVYRANDRPEPLADIVSLRSPDILVLQELTPALAQETEAMRDQYPFQLHSDPPWVAILSRLPFEASRIVEVPSAGGERSVLEVRVAYEDGLVTIYGLHAIGPSTPGGFQSRGSQFEAVRELVGSSSDPVIVAGDFNATVLSRPFGALLGDTGARTAISGRREAPTWPSWAGPLGLRVDHILVRDLEVCSVLVGPTAGSDHQAVTVDLRIARSSDTDQSLER